MTMTGAIRFVLNRIANHFEYLTLRQMSSFSDRELSDIGLNRSHIGYAARGTVLARDEVVGRGAQR